MVAGPSARRLSHAKGAYADRGQHANHIAQFSNSENEGPERRMTVFKRIRVEHGLGEAHKKHVGTAERSHDG
jgi:hypothetical protein